MERFGYPTPAGKGAARRGRNLRLAIWRLRHLVIALAVGVIVTSVLRIFAPVAAGQVEILVATHALEVGQPLTASDVTVAQLPLGGGSEWLADSPDQVLGRIVLAPISAGTPIWLPLVSSNELSSLAPPGTVVVSIVLDSSAVTLLTPGDSADLVTYTEGAARVLARSALVLPPRSGAGVGGGLLSLPSIGGSGAATLFAVRPAEAPDLAVAARQGQVSAILVG
jgi:Flp pilus assembly protein CpaB